MDFDESYYKLFPKLHSAQYAERLITKDQAGKIKMAHRYRRLYRHLVQGSHIARDCSRTEKEDLDYR